MDSKTEEIVNQLKSYERQGLSYYQARQNLLKDGFTELQIDDAEDEYRYTEPAAANTSKPVANETSSDDAYDKVSSILLKNAKKDSKAPSFFTLWSPSTYGLKIEQNTYFMKYGSGGLTVVLVALLASLILTFAAPHIFSPQITDNTQYCKNTFAVSSECTPASALSYGWPVHGADIKYEAQGKVIGSTTDSGVYETNFALFFVAICLAAFLANLAMTRL